MPAACVLRFDQASNRRLIGPGEYPIPPDKPPTIEEGHTAAQMGKTAPRAVDRIGLADPCVVMEEPWFAEAALQ